MLNVRAKKSLLLRESSWGLVGAGKGHHNNGTDEALPSVLVLELESDMSDTERVCVCFLPRRHQPCSTLETPISPALPGPAASDSVRRRCDSSWDEASPLIRPSRLPSTPLPVSTAGICLCGWFSSIGCLT